MDAFPPSDEPLDPVIGGVLVQLTEDPAECARAEAMLRAHPAITVGSVAGVWVTLAVEARHARAARDLHAWIATIPGVRWLEVSAVFFEGESTESAPSHV